MRLIRRGVLSLLASVVLLAIGLGWFLMRSRSQPASAVIAGEALARDLGCFACHGPGGTQPIANPGAPGRTVPSWGGGNWMMYNDSPQDIREWILYGRREGHEPAGDPLLPMPAYEKWLNDEELGQLTAYVLAVSQFGWPEEPIATGREVAVRFGCFSCHGPEGRGGVKNPGSFKGYIPGWDGTGARSNRLRRVGHRRGELSHERQPRRPHFPQPPGDPNARLRRPHQQRGVGSARRLRGLGARDATLLAEKCTGNFVDSSRRCCDQGRP